MLHEPGYMAPSSVGIFKGKHHDITNAAFMEYLASRERVLLWIAKHIDIDGEHTTWVTTTPNNIAKATLNFQAKVCWLWSGLNCSQR